MALTPDVIYAELALARTAGGFPFLGLQFDRLAWGIATGISTWAISQPQNVALTGAAVGTAGAGAIAPLATKVLVLPNPPIVLAGLTSGGLVGPTAPSLAAVVGIGVANAFTKFAQYAGVVAGVGIGADTSKVVVANPAGLQATLYASMFGTVAAGPILPMLIQGLSIGVCNLVLTGTGVGTVTGPPAPASAVGVSTSVIV